MKTLKCVNKFILQTIKNYKNMKNKISKIWCVLFFIIYALTSCNVTRKITTEASYFQKGDTTCTIVTKTTETYDAKKNVSNL